MNFFSPQQMFSRSQQSFAPQPPIAATSSNSIAPPSSHRPLQFNPMTQLLSPHQPRHLQATSPQHYYPQSHQQQQPHILSSPQGNVSQTTMRSSTVGFSSPLMRSNLTVFQQPPHQATGDQHVAVAAHQISNKRSSNSSYQTASSAAKSPRGQLQQAQPQHFQKIMRQESVPASLQNSRLTMQSLPAHILSQVGFRNNNNPSSTQGTTNGGVNTAFSSPSSGVQRIASVYQQQFNDNSSTSSKQRIGPATIPVVTSPLQRPSSSQKGDISINPKQTSLGSNGTISATAISPSEYFSVTGESFFSSKKFSMEPQKQQPYSINAKNAMNLNNKNSNNNNNNNNILTQEMQSTVQVLQQRLSEAIARTQQVKLKTGNSESRSEQPIRKEQMPATTNDFKSNGQQSVTTNSVHSQVQSHTNNLQRDSLQWQQKLLQQQHQPQTASPLMSAPSIGSAIKTENEDTMSSPSNQLSLNQAEFQKVLIEYHAVQKRLQSIIVPQTEYQQEPKHEQQETSIEQQEHESNRMVTNESEQQWQMQQVGAANTTVPLSQVNFKITSGYFRNVFIEDKKNPLQGGVSQQQLPAKVVRKSFNNGDYFEGSMDLKGTPNGFGILKDSTGTVIYSGEWECGHFNGFGVLINKNYLQQQLMAACTDVKLANYLESMIKKENWHRYEGELKDNHVTGFGTLFYSDSKFINRFDSQNHRIIGHFERGLPHGQCSYYGDKERPELVAIWNKGRVQEVLWTSPAAA